MEKNEKIKTKVRFTSLDVAAIVQNLQTLIGMRTTNIYDLNPSTYLIKLSRSEEKSYLLIENGVRFHTTNEKPDKKALPSGFTMKFRKFLRSKRLESIRQVGVERVVVFTFGSESFANHLIIELYAQGNIILTDNEYRILQCIRSHEYNDKVKTAVGEIYPFEYAANIYLENLVITEQKVHELLENDEKDNQTGEKLEESQKNKGKKANKKGPIKIKDIVFKLIPCLFPSVIEHILLSNEKNPEEKVEKTNKNLIIECGEICLNFLRSFLESKHKGFLFYKSKEESFVKKQENQEEKPEIEYFEFSSYKNAKYLNFPCKETSTFDEAVNEYFQNYKKFQHQEEEDVEGLAWKKYDQIKRDQDERVKKLQLEQDIYKVKAEYIEKNVGDVDAIIKIIKTMEDNGYSWDDISRMIAESKKNGDPLANTIHDLNILKRQVTILLGDPVSEEQMFELLPVEINIDYNAYTNATMYYESKKKNFQKELRTKEASEQVLKLAEKEALKKIEKKKNEIFSKNLPQRKTFWFEKFAWFITSEGFLVISGKDSHQNELLVKRYMRPTDIYMHSDYGGAASTVIKNSRKGFTPPLTTLEEAAIFTVCRSKAWETKIISGAWWVYPEQVSKSAPTGEFLPTGSFMIRGKRNFIYPNRMEMGMTLLFKVDNESGLRHLNDRRIHEEEEKKELEDNKKIIQINNDKDQDEFAIVSIDTQTRKVSFILIKQKNEEKNKLKEAQKIEGAKKKETYEEPDEEIEENDSEDEEEGEKINLTKKISQSKNTKKTKEKEEKINESNQQKHKQRNKKKLKKLEKYLEEQDEDEREIIMKMLGAKEMKHMTGSEPIDDKNIKTQKGKKGKKEGKKGISKYFNVEEDDQEIKDKLNPDKVLFLKEKQLEKKLLENSSSSEDEELEINETNPTNETSENLETVEENTETVEKEHEEDKDNEETEMNQPEKVEDQEQEVDEKTLDSELGELYKLVGNPYNDDKFEFFVPMCAPYNSIKENKFKIKLVPGGLKKGKAARNIIQYFQTCEVNEREKILLKSLQEQEVINAIIGNVKLAGAGLLKMELKEKQLKKMKKKEEDKKSIDEIYK